MSGNVDESMFTWWMSGQAKLSEILSGLPHEGVGDLFLALDIMICCNIGLDDCGELPIWDLLLLATQTIGVGLSSCCYCQANAAATSRSRLQHDQLHYYTITG